MTDLYYIGIDPGWAGGVAVIRDSASGSGVRCYRTPENQDPEKRRRMLEILRPYKGLAGVRVTLEHVGGWGGDSFSTEDLCRNHEIWRAYLDGLGIKFEDVYPQTWKKAFPKPADFGPLPKVPKGKELRNLALLLMQEKPHDFPDLEQAQKTIQGRASAAERAERKRRKDHYKEITRELFPSVEVTDWNCDALLLAEFGRRTSPALSTADLPF